MNDQSKYTDATGFIPQSALWSANPRDIPVGKARNRAMLKADSSEGILTISFTDDKILDAMLIRQIQDELFAILDETANQIVLLDFRAVKSLSSVAFEMLVQTYKRCKVSKMNLKLCNLAPNIRQILKITALDRILDIHADAAAAEQAFMKKSRFFR
jgi:anti-anti-sigma factor